MRDSSRFTLDANILIYAAVADDPQRHQVAASLLRRAVGGDCILLVQALAEFFNVATRKVKLPDDIASSLIETWLQMFPCSGASPETLLAAVRAVNEYRLSFWDAMIWAAAEEAGCRWVLSEDFQNGRTLDGVTFVNPFTPAGLPEDFARALGEG